MLRGVKCNICGAIGQHYSSACTLRITGIPAGMRDESNASVAESSIEDIEKPRDLFLNPLELTASIRNRYEVPAFLRCRACALMAADAVWCQCCDIFVCAQCLGPADGTWMCPLCENTSVDSFHVIKAIRAAIDAWFQGAAQQLDPYAVSSDDEKAPAPAVVSFEKPFRKRVHKFAKRN